MKEKIKKISIGIIIAIITISIAFYVGMEYKSYQTRKVFTDYTEGTLIPVSEELEYKEELVPELDETEKGVAQMPTSSSIALDNKLPEQVPSLIETWEELQKKHFALADQNGLTVLTITNSLGETRSYKKAGTLWLPQTIEKKTPAPPIALPTLQQSTNLRRFCLSDAYLNSVCEDPAFMPGYNSNMTFRLLIDDLITKYFAFLSDQEKQRISAEEIELNCLMAPTPEDERMLEPATQNYLRQIRCGTVTDTDRTNYELSRIKSSVDELKYRLDQKISFPALYLDPIKAPTFTNPQWQIRWEGSGGTITDSSGDLHQFHCEYNICRSY
jgi:hypothetical protein